MLDQVAEFRRTRRVKEGTGSSASVSAAFGPVGPIHPGNPGLKARIVAFSRAATPYRVIEVPDTLEDIKTPAPRLAPRARSPERGQLLIALILAGIDISGLQDITFD